MSITLFDAAGGDLQPLVAIHAACFPDPWDAASLAGLLATPGTFAFHDDDGFVLARAAAGEAEILTIAVRPAARGRGLGRALMIAAAAQAWQAGAESLFLEVSTANPAALALYGRLGFARVGARRGYYAGQDALVLRLPLPAEFA